MNAIQQPTLPERRVGSFDWEAIATQLDAAGFAVVQGLLNAHECEQLSALYPYDEYFRSCVVMSRHGFGRGEYRYFAYPLPPVIEQLRTSFYPHLAAIANRWHEAMDLAPRFPTTHADFLAQCHEAGQTRPTPLLLQYGAGDYNCLHQDLYGEHFFRCSSRSCCRNPKSISPAANSC